MARERISGKLSERVRREGERGDLGSNSVSEWYEVRQKRYLRRGNSREGNGLVSNKVDWKRVWDTDKRTMTFFVKNFPDSSMVRSLTETFGNIGWARDVFIPNKKGKDGIRYGFVCFGGNIDKARVERSLNNIWIGSFKLRANVSKCERQAVNQTLRVEKTIPKRQISSQARRREGVSYKEAMHGRTIDKEKVN